MKSIKITLLLILLIIHFFLDARILKGQNCDTVDNKEIYKHSVDFCPLSPLFKIYAIDYCYRVA